MKAKRICAAIAVVGVLLMFSGWASAGFSFENLFADKTVYVEVSKAETLAANDTVEIETDVEAVLVGVSEDDQAHIRYFDSEKRTHSYAYSGGVLSVSAEGREWYEYVSFNFAPSEKAIELLLPADFRGELRVATSTGEVNVERVVGLERMDIALTTGDLRATNCAAKEAWLRTTTGWLSVSDLTADALTAETTTGGMKLETLAAASLTARFTTGNVALSGADCETIDIRGTTGDIRLDGVIGKSITLRTSTGSVSGGIACAATEFTVDSSTATGWNNLQNLNNGGARTLSVETATGDIDIAFDE